MIGVFKANGCVPTGLLENIRWRIHLRRRAVYDVAFRNDLIDACRLDFDFFVNAFCVLHEPRAELAKVIPFVSWPHQDVAVKQLWPLIGREDFGMEKSRAEGATWLYLLILLHRWLFEPYFAGGLVTRNEDTVDSPTDPDSLFAKLDWQISMLPTWLVPDYKRSISDHSLKNLDNMASLVGYAATADTGSGGRKSVFVIDEHAKFDRGKDELAWEAIRAVTHSRGTVSTYWGETGTYWEIMTEEDSEMKKIRLVWWENPTRNKCLYNWYPGKLVAENPKEQALVNRYARLYKDRLSRLERSGFMEEGQRRSPWYDRECIRPRTTPESIAQELDCNPGKSVGKLFRPSLLARLRPGCRDVEMKRGELVYNAWDFAPQKFVESPSGRLMIFTPIGGDGKPPKGNYVFGADVALGSGGTYSSNSVIEGMDATTGEHVCEFASPSIEGASLAEYMTALATWFWMALVNWEVTGAGGTLFTNRFWGENLYPNVFFMPGGSRKKPGYHCPRTEDKIAWLQRLGVAMGAGDFIPRSEAFLDECRPFEVLEGYRVVHGKKKTTGHGLPHGDRVIGASIMWMAASEVGQSHRSLAVGGKERPWEEMVYSHEVPSNSFAARRIAEWRRSNEDAEERELSLLDEYPGVQL